MPELLLEKQLRLSEPNTEVRNVARARTLTVLPQLDAHRKGNLIQFLYESKLLEIISLGDANLSGADLIDANLSGSDLLLANLSGADLLGANLSGANLKLANLNGAKVTTEQLAQASSLKGATMPDGSIHP